jgi:membrane protein implicated in regulation of membrane protease activity
MNELQEYLKPEYIWAFIGVVLLIMELFIPGLVVFFFGVGALLVAAICLFANISLNVQLLVFLITSVAFLLALRNRLKGIFSGFSKSRPSMSQNPPEFIGEKVTVLQAITPIQPGMVEMHGTNWKARADVAISAGAVVEIIGSENLTLVVKPITS